MRPGSPVSAAGWLLAASLLPCMQAQTHAVKKPETVVRAVAVFEWTGDEAKPTASRLVPVSIFINGQLDDAGLYLARPVPFALDRGTIFECEIAGRPEGTVDLEYQRHLEGTSETPFDDGWTAYGPFKPVPAQTEVAAKQRGPLPQVVASNSNRPRFSNTSSAGSGSSTPPADSSKPSMRRRDGSSSDASSGDSSSTTTTASTGATPASKPADTTPVTPVDDDPNKPVLVRRSGSDGDPSATAGSTASTASTTSSADSDKPTMQRRTSDPDATSPSTSTTSSGSTSDSTDDADRPTLKRRPPNTPGQKINNKRPQDTASVTSSGSLNDDPDRPVLHRGTTAVPDVTALIGLPADMKQMVAVSDAKDRPEHQFARVWESSDERAAVLEQMQAAARDRLARYDVPAAGATPAVAPPAPPTRAASAAKGRKAAPVLAAAAPVSLTSEDLRGYTLSYGGAATFVYSAASPGVGGVTRYVTVVAQKETLGTLKVALTSVTDTKHFDRTPWMRLVDVVDAEASNRASLLFELRGETSRQFALYRVIGARAEQAFATGTTQ